MGVNNAEYQCVAPPSLTLPHKGGRGRRDFIQSPIALLDVDLNLIEPIRVFPHQPDQVLELLFFPIREDAGQNPFAGGVDLSRHRLALGGDDGLAHAAVGAARGARPGPGLQLGDLTADVV